MATLEDAAEDLVVKLRGLDTEIEESERKLGDLKEKVEETASDVDEEWTALAGAVSSLLATVKEEQERLQQQAQQTHQALTDTQNAVAEDGAEARTEIAQGRSQLEALDGHAAGLEPAVESLAADAGEAPARGLAQRARDLEQELERVVEDARDFLRDEVVPAIEARADDVRQACQELHRLLAEESTAALQKAYDDWESRVDDLEQYVATQGFNASRQHAHNVADYALEQCRTASLQQLDDLQPLLDALGAQLQDLAAGAQRATDALVAQAGAALAQELDGTATSAAAAVGALDAVRALLSSYSFVGM